MAVRPLAAVDMPAVKGVIDATGLFPSEMMDGMAAAHLAGAAEELWLVHDDGAPLGVLFAAPERMTAGTWNALLLAIHPDAQGRGLGSALMAAAEAEAHARGAHLMLVETSGDEGFEAARAFYRGRGYAEEARVRDFYRPGEDKLIFRKVL